MQILKRGPTPGVGGGGDGGGGGGGGGGEEYRMSPRGERMVVEPLRSGARQ